jgi:hypothetical protein
VKSDDYFDMSSLLELKWSVGRVLRATSTTTQVPASNLNQRPLFWWITRGNHHGAIPNQKSNSQKHDFTTLRGNGKLPTQ